MGKQAEDSENYQKFKEIVKKKKINVISVEAGENSHLQDQENNKKIKNVVETIGQTKKIQIEKNLYFDVIWPDTQNMISENALNNNSLVLKLNYKSFSMLFTGDIEEIAEKQILKEYKNNLEKLKSTVLKAGHHGSKTSSTQEFIETVKPKIVLIGVGENNNFGHPSGDVIQRLENQGTKIYRTDQMGEIMLTVKNKGKIKIKNFIN